MIKINLLPHREAKRKQKKAAFVALLAFGAIVGGVIVVLVGGYNASRISIQNERNEVIRAENLVLDKQIAEIATLKQEIEALKARQQAVEDLQSDRNTPVLLLDELVKQTPPGVYLKAFKQNGQRVTLLGYAQSQERVAELLRNVADNSQWLERPDLGEVRAVPLAKSTTGKRVVEFNMVVGIQRPRDKEAALAAAAKAGAAAPATAARAPGAAVPAAVPAAK
jgi:type IV pilus assembly protein PilN